MNLTSPSHFRGEASLHTYVAWVRSGQTLLGIEEGFGRRFSDSLLRGIRASYVPQPKVILRSEHVEKPVIKAIRNGLVHYARAFAICYHFTLRAQSEAFALTLDGACNGRHGVALQGNLLAPRRRHPFGVEEKRQDRIAGGTTLLLQSLQGHLRPMRAARCCPRPHRTLWIASRSRQCSPTRLGIGGSSKSRAGRSWCSDWSG